MPTSWCSASANWKMRKPSPSASVESACLRRSGDSPWREKAPIVTQGWGERDDRGQVMTTSSAWSCDQGPLTLWHGRAPGINLDQYFESTHHDDNASSSSRPRG